MCLLILFILAACACIARMRRRPNVAWFFAFLLAVLSLVLGLGVTSRMAMSTIAPDAAPEILPWKDKNAIVVLGAGTDRAGDLADVNTIPIGYSRVFQGARRYFECQKAGKRCHLFLSGGDPWGHGVSEAAVMAKEMKQIGVPESAITVEGNSYNTFQNADFTSKLLEKDPADLVVLVTSGFHLSRAELYFSHFNVSVLGDRSDLWTGSTSMVPVAVNMAMIDLAMHEHLGIWLFYVYNFMGWNK